MIFLAALLSWGWPVEQTTWAPPSATCPAGLVRRGPIPMTGSMRPALHGGEFYCAERYTGQPLIAGQIVEIVVARDGIRRLHRITATSRSSVITAGDANRCSDGWSPKGNISFVVRYVHRKA